ncbi:MAG: hypothetical protein F4Z28_15770 [Gammaproteobacteria bacterium]|nr:hypothetical protein [Gammaproteobacteria bacterium]
MARQTMLRPTAPVPLAIALAWALSASAAEDRPEARPDDPVQVVQADSSEPEEVIVIGEPEDPFKPHDFEYMQSTYDARGRGSCLYRRGDYAESFPYLLAAAKRGFKYAQARVSFLYQQGLGTARDAEASIGWLSVAAIGTTHPEIRNRFLEVWRQVPDEQRPYYQRVVNGYRAKYASQRHRVTCDFAPTAGSHIPSLTCRFADEANYMDINAILEGRAPISTPPNPYGAGC